MRKDYTVPDIFHEIVVKHPKKPCFLLQDEVWTFEEVRRVSSKNYLQFYIKKY